MVLRRPNAHAARSAKLIRAAVNTGQDLPTPGAQARPRHFTSKDGKMVPGPQHAQREREKKAESIANVAAHRQTLLPSVANANALSSGT